MFGYIGRMPVLSQTFCSKAAAIVDIAVQRRKIFGECRLAVCSTNDSIQESSFLLPLTLVGSVVVFEPVWVFGGIIFALVPAYFAVIWDAQDSSMRELNGNYEVVEELWDDFVFVFFGVHKGQGVVFMHGDDNIAFAPDI